MGEKEIPQPDSLAPVAVKGADIEVEAAAMNRGRSRTIAFFATALIVVGVGTGWLMSGLDETRTLAAAGQTLSEIDRTGFDRFWGCALKGVDVRSLDTEADLIYQVQIRSTNGGIRYARQVNQRCLETLDEVETLLNSVNAPPDLEPRVQNMIKSVTALRGAWKRYIGFMTRSSGEYDLEAARPHLTSIGQGWSGFKSEYQKAKQSLRESAGL